jgi:hypothetical protein
MSGRRADAETQINWIFILAGGAIFLFVIFKFIGVQRSSSELASAAAVRDRLESAILSSLSTSQLYFEDTMNVEDVRVRTSCEEGGIFVSDQLGPVDLGPVFCSASLGSNSGNLFFKSVRWGGPISAGSLIFLASDANSYLLVSNPGYDEMISEVEKMLPKDADVERVGELSTILNSINERKGKIVRVAYFGEEPSDEQKKELNNIKGVSLVKIQPGQDRMIGEVVFYNKTGNEKAVPYMGYELLTAAILSENAEEYACSANKAFSRMAGVLNVTSKRLALIQTSSSDECKVFMGAVIKNIDEVILPNYLSKFKIEETDQTKITGLYGNLTQIASTNNMLERLSCPTVY